LNAKKQRLCRHLSSTSSSSSMTNPLQDQVPDSIAVGDHPTSPPLPAPPPSCSSLVLDVNYFNFFSSIQLRTLFQNVYHSHDDHESSPTILPCLMEESPSDSGLSDGTKTTHPDDIHEPITNKSAIVDLSKPLSKEEMLAIMQIIRELWKKQFNCDIPNINTEFPTPISTTSFKRIGELSNLAEKTRTQYRSTPALNKLNAELNDIKDKLKRFSNERIPAPLIEEQIFESNSNLVDVERIQTKKETFLRHQMQRREEQLMKKAERQIDANERQNEHRLFEEYLAQRRHETNKQRSNILQAHLEQKRFEFDPLSTNDYYFAAARNRQRLKRKTSLSSFFSVDDDLSYSSSLNQVQTPKRSLTRFDLMSPSLTAPTAASKSKMNRAASSCHIHRGYYDSSTSLNSKGIQMTSGSLNNLSKTQTPKKKSTSFIDEIFDDSQFTASMTSLNTSLTGRKSTSRSFFLIIQQKRNLQVRVLFEIRHYYQRNRTDKRLLIH